MDASPPPVPAAEPAEPAADAPAAGAPGPTFRARTPAETLAVLMALGFVARAGDPTPTFRFAA